MKYIIVSILSVLLLSRCSTDIDLTAPYEDVTIIFGLLDQSRDIQFIKINKAFLGDAALEDMAANRDSVEYPPGGIVSKRVEEWQGNIKTNEWELKDSLIEAINESIFYVADITNPLRKVFYFESDELNQDAEYRVVVEFDNKPDVVGMTQLIPNSSGSVRNPTSNLAGQQSTNQRINFASTNSSINDNYPNYRFRWRAEDGARRYELLLQFRYIENVWTDASHTTLISSEEKSFDWDLGSEESDGISGDDLEKIVNGETFFLQIAQRLEVNENITREIGVLDEGVETNHYSAFNFTLTIADEDLSSYLEFNEPATSLAQERPQWTNINNGQGLFSARLQQKAVNVKLHSNSIKELATGQHTSQLNFCTKDLVYLGEIFYCE